jgi:hypothetical protein
MRRNYPHMACNHLPHKRWRVISLLDMTMMRPYSKALDGQ